MNTPQPEQPANPHLGKRILYIPVEFGKWKMARSMPYDIQLGLEEGFAASGAKVTTLPAFWDHPSSSASSWLSRAKSLLAGQTFDQVWVIVVHCQFEDDFLDWLKTLAPVRVGFVHESLECTPEECQLWPPYKYRRGYVEHQLRALTHAVTWDEYAAEWLNEAGVVKGLWWPGCVPARVITPPVAGYEQTPAVFCGSAYGERGVWLQREDLRNLFARVTGPEDATALPANFDRLQEDTFKYLSSHPTVTLQDLNDYLFALRQLRRESFDLWMPSMKMACAQVNLPSVVKAYGVRVVEAMAAGCPAISWDVPNRPRNRNLFRAGEEILLFRRDQPAELAAHIRHLQQEPEFARQMAARAQAKLAKYHTIEIRVRQVFDWIATGAQPDFGEVSAPAEPCLAEDPTPAPTADETARWNKISALVNNIIDNDGAKKDRRLLDVGCARGWLANLASTFGQCDGLESDSKLLGQARRLFPQLRFFAGSVETLLNEPDFRPYDFVIATEMLEYVPQGRQPEFVRNLGRLLKPGGHVILTTPRGEAYQEWGRSWPGPFRPAESWLVEPAVRQLFERHNFKVAGHERVLFNTCTRQYLAGEPTPEDKELLALYQVWAFQNPVAHAAAVAPVIIKPDEVLAQFHRACKEAARNALQLLPDHAVLLTGQATALLGRGEVEAARKILAWLVALQPDYAPGRRLLARVLQQLNLSAEADAQNRRAAELENAVSVPEPLVTVVLPDLAATEFSFLQHAADATAPDGTPARLDTRTTTIQQRAAPCVYIHPSTKMRFSVPSPQAGCFSFAVGLQPDAWNKVSVAGCEFSVESNGREIFRREIAPRRLPTEQRWHEITVDVPAAGGPSHEFVLRTRATGPSPDFRWAVWCDPVFRPNTCKPLN